MKATFYIQQPRQFGYPMDTRFKGTFIVGVG